jgi:hypothetical protein
MKILKQTLSMHIHSLDSIRFLQIEKLARVQYLSGKDPKSCALLYLALQRKNVLTSLFKLSRDEKDKVLYEFLTRDFQVLVIIL